MKRVLVVDDIEENLYLLQVTLGSQGYQVESAADGCQALEIARKDPPDLIISDLLMPSMDGYTLLRHWQEDDRLRSVPFVVHTATYTHPQDQELAYELGAAAYLLKPMEPDLFINKIAKVLESWTEPEPHPRSSESAERHNEVLFRKLTSKSAELERANAALQRDLEERRLAEERALRSESMYRTAARLGKLGGWTLEIAGGTLEWSDEVCLLHDMPLGSRPTLSGALDFFAPEERERVTDAFRRCLEQGEPLELEAEVVTAQGRRIWVRVVGERVSDEQGEPRCLQGAVQDITERRALETQFMRAQRLESIGTLTGGIAHDLSNLLAPIMLTVDLLKVSESDPGRLELLAILAKSAHRAKFMIRQVLTFARGVEGERTYVSIPCLLQELQEICRETFPKNLRLKVDVEAGLWPVRGDATQLHQVLLNLFVNARDAMPDGGELHLSTSNRTLDHQYASLCEDLQAGDYVSIEVKDSGCGIPAEHLDRIFEPFFTTKAVGRGTGLGLSTTLAIIRSHGGHLRVQSEPGKGTCFRILLPAELNAEAEGFRDDTPSTHGNNELVLLVEDEPEVAKVTRLSLESYGYRVEWARDGAEGVARFALFGPEIAVVLTDLAMPVLDGVAMIRALRAIDPGVRVLATSGWAEGRGVRSLADQGVPLLLKPYTQSELFAALAHARRAPAAVVSEVECRGGGG